MGISEADTTEDDLLWRGVRNEQRRSLLFPFLPECGQGRMFFLSPQCSVPCQAAGSRDMPQLHRGPRHCGSPTEKNMPCLDVFRG